MRAYIASGRHRERLRELRAQAKAAGFCCSCRKRIARPGRVTCQECADRSRDYEQRTRKGTRKRETAPQYRPIDWLLDRPQVRILRALRWFDLVDRDDLMIVLGVKDSDPKTRDCYAQALSRAIKCGYVLRKFERSIFQNGKYKNTFIKITTKGREVLARLFETSTIGVEP